MRETNNIERRQSDRSNPHLTLPILSHSANAEGRCCFVSGDGRYNHSLESDEFLTVRMFGVDPTHDRGCRRRIPTTTVLDVNCDPMRFRRPRVTRSLRCCVRVRARIPPHRWRWRSQFGVSGGAAVGVACAFVGVLAARVRHALVRGLVARERRHREQPAVVGDKQLQTELVASRPGTTKGRCTQHTAAAAASEGGAGEATCRLVHLTEH